MRPLLTLLLLILAPPNLALSLPNPSPQPVTPLQLPPPNLPYPAGNTATTCPHPADHNNLFTLNAFLPAGNRRFHRPGIAPAPRPIGRNLEHAPRALTHICQQVGGFVFGPLGATAAKTQDVWLQPGKQHVFSVAADAAVQRILAWDSDAAYPRSDARVYSFRGANPGMNVGSLVLPPLESAVKVFFLVAFDRLLCSGEVGLFAIGGE